AHHREEPDAALAQPRPLLTGGELDVGAGPPATPAVLVVPVEPRRALPVLPGQVDAVADAHPSLLRGADEEEAAERPERLTAEVDRRLLVDQQHPLAGGDQLGRGDQAGQAGPHDDDIAVHEQTSASTTVRRPQPSDRAPGRRPPGAAPHAVAPPSPVREHSDDPAAPPTMGGPCRYRPLHRSAADSPGGCGCAGRSASSPWWRRPTSAASGQRACS